MNLGPLVAKILATLYVSLVVLIAAFAAYVWRLRCEGFGCTGVGVAWFAWVLLFMVVLALGHTTKRLTQLSTPIRQAMRWIVLAQLVGGAFLVLALVFHNAA